MRDGGSEGAVAGEACERAGIEVRWCPAGEFVRGSPEGEEGRYANEGQGEVVVRRGFWLARTAVTRGQWAAVMGPGEGQGGGDALPMTRASWGEVGEFVARLNGGGGLDAGWAWRLPTEAQWEYACRAGRTGPYGGESLDELGWYGGNSDGRLREVGLKRENAWGLCDLHGDVWEWCADWYGLYGEGRATDPEGPATGDYRVVRGGSWMSLARHCRCAVRVGVWPGRRFSFVGFRVALCRVEDGAPGGGEG